MSEKKEFKEGQLVAYRLKKDGSLHRDGVILEMPIHPNTWWLVRTHIGDCKFRSSDIDADINKLRMQPIVNQPVQKRIKKPSNHFKLLREQQLEQMRQQLQQQQKLQQGLSLPWQTQMMVRQPPWQWSPERQRYEWPVQQLELKQPIQPIQRQSVEQQMWQQQLATSAIVVQQTNQQAATPEAPPSNWEAQAISLLVASRRDIFFTPEKLTQIKASSTPMEL
jgi:hypothetical protein